MFNAQERREDGKIDYTRQQITGAQQRETKHIIKAQKL